MTIETRKPIGWLASVAIIISGLAVPALVPATIARADTQVGCVEMGTAESGGFFVFNRCGHQVIGSFCYLNDRFFPCGMRRNGGFGPLAPGASERVTAPSNDPFEWRVAYCNYQDWPRACTVGEPG